MTIKAADATVLRYRFSSNHVASRENIILQHRGSRASWGHPVHHALPWYQTTASRLVNITAFPQTHHLSRKRDCSHQFPRPISLPGKKIRINRRSPKRITSPGEIQHHRHHPTMLGQIITHPPLSSCGRTQSPSVSLQGGTSYDDFHDPESFTCKHTDFRHFPRHYICTRNVPVVGPSDIPPCPEKIRISHFLLKKTLNRARHPARLRHTILL